MTTLQEKNINVKLILLAFKLHHRKTKETYFDLTKSFWNYKIRQKVQWGKLGHFGNIHHVSKQWHHTIVAILTLTVTESYMILIDWKVRMKKKIPFEIQIMLLFSFVFVLTLKKLLNFQRIPSSIKCDHVQENILWNTEKQKQNKTP